MLGIIPLQLSAVSCGAYFNWTVATVAQWSGGTLYGDHVTYVCPLGYAFSTEVFSSVVFCGPEGDWVPNIPYDCQGRWIMEDCLINIYCASLTYTVPSKAP